MEHEEPSVRTRVRASRRLPALVDYVHDSPSSEASLVLSPAVARAEALAKASVVPDDGPAVGVATGFPRTTADT